MAFSYYKSATLASAQAGTADSSNWPLTIARDGNVQVADADLKDTGHSGFVQSTSGYDIRPYSDSALTTPLTYELVYYDGVNGKLEMHVNIATLSHTVDTVIYLAFGDASIVTDGSSTSTWNTNYKGVWHLAQAASPATDSTSTGTNATQTGGVTFSATGQMDSAVSLAKASTQSLSMGDTASLRPASAFTVSAWVKRSGAVAAFDLWGAVASNDSTQHGWFMALNDTNKVEFYVDKNGAYSFATATSNAALSDGVLTHLVGVWDGTTVTLYVNSVAQTATAAASTIGYGTGGNVTIGISGGSTWNGVIDEVRISDTNRAASWITAEYNAQIASSTFITWGTKVSTSSFTWQQLVETNKPYRDIIGIVGY